MEPKWTGLARWFLLKIGDPSVWLNWTGSWKMKMQNGTRRPKAQNEEAAIAIAIVCPFHRSLFSHLPQPPVSRRLLSCTVAGHHHHLAPSRHHHICDEERLWERDRDIIKQVPLSLSPIHMSAVVEFCLSFKPKKSNKTESEREREIEFVLCCGAESTTGEMRRYTN